MAANKRKQDEKHLKILREMVALPHNKYCFDCNQRGPTYVNMTVGSFVCTACSGILRGLNPPHRVKSISMTSFTIEEMDFLKSHGNDLCKKVWLALYESRLHTDHDSKDEQKRKDFLIQKYERKRWHQAPTDQMLQEARVQNDTQVGKKEAKPLKTLLGHNATKLVVSENQSSARPVVPVSSHSSQQSQQRTVTPSLSQGSISSTGSQQSAGSQPSRQNATTNQTTTGGAFDLLADLGSDPFAPKPTPAPVQSTGQAGGFANFESAFSSNFPAASAPAPFAGTPSTGVPPVAPSGGVSMAQVPAASIQQTTAPGFGAFTTAGGPPQTGLATSQAPAGPPSVGGSDKYAALADLDNLFGSSSGQSINWDGQFSSPPHSASVATSQMWNAQPAQPAVSAPAANPFSGVPGNFGQAPPAPNPFAAAPMTNQQPAFASTANQQPVFATAANQQAAPFGHPAAMGVPTSQSHFSQSNSFPAFPAQNNSFGQFPSSQSAMAGGEVQTSSFNGWSGSNQSGMKAGFQTQPHQQQGFAQWGQPAPAAAPNPFMNITAQQGIPAKSHSTNPFL